MTPPVPPRVECDRQHPSLAVADVAAAVAYYTTRLGFRLDFMAGEPAAMGYCHCSSCREWSAGPVNAFSLWPPDSVKSVVTPCARSRRIPS